MYEMSEEEVAAARRVILSRKLFRYQGGTGGECDAFEHEFAKKIRTAHSVLVTSGTNALLAALKAIGVGPGDEVIVPAYTFVATPAAVVLAGAFPVVANIDDTLGLSPTDLAAKIGPRTKAVIPVHMDGLATDMDAVMKVASAHGIAVIEDCAQAIGGSFRGRRLGAIGQIGAYSLNENKIISCGEGGIVATSDRALYEKIFCYQDLSARFHPLKKEIFRAPPTDFGMSMRVSELQGAILRVQLERLDGLLAKLRERKNILAAHLAAISGAQIIRGNCEAGDCGTSLHLRFDDPALAALAAKNLAEAGILAAFPSLRPAHVAWKWLDLVAPETATTARLDLLPSVQILMSVLRYEIDPSLDRQATERIGEIMGSVLRRARFPSAQNYPSSSEIRPASSSAAP